MTRPKGYSRHDLYARARCRCSHLQYADDTPGGPCRFCDCADHRAGQPPEDTASTGDAA